MLLQAPEARRNGVRNHSTPVIPAVTRAQSRHAIGKRVLEPGTLLAVPTQTLTSTPSCLRVFVRGQISNQPHIKTRRHEERCKGEDVLLGRVPVSKELLRLPGASAPASHLLASEEEKTEVNALRI